MGGSKSDFKTINLCFRMEWVDMDFTTCLLLSFRKVIYKFIISISDKYFPRNREII
jgi:hypothetical protein